MNQISQSKPCLTPRSSFVILPPPASSQHTPSLSSSPKNTHTAAPRSWAENLAPIERELWARLRQEFSHIMTELAAETKLLKDEYGAQVKRIEGEGRC
jgi:hypothetical protein